MESEESLESHAFFYCVLRRKVLGSRCSGRVAGLGRGAVAGAVGGELHGGASPLQIVVTALGPAS